MFVDLRLHVPSDGTADRARRRGRHVEPSLPYPGSDHDQSRCDNSRRQEHTGTRRQSAR